MKSKNKNNSVSYFDMQFITSSISTTLVLLLLGLVVFFVLAAHNLSIYVRENINFSVLISDDMKEADILKLRKRLDTEPFVKQTEYISKKQALKEQTEAMGTDPEEFLGYNPFTASIEIKLHSDYANSDSIAKIEKLIKKNDKLPFSLSLYVKVARMVQDLNRLARANRLVEPEDVLYSIQQEGAPKGKFYVVRNY